ncbi:DDRGK domain-containing protein 1 isoform X2 [Pseudonaja textilis]|uniref:DDRGK domain-containing protein 1 isoform X2 n=1 Tax=Pseudonaja textilis TaxID=8673 RepID=UPI000EA99B8A|nr:DDRGK domain-containing protein 1 isoform X2 [Pseudonaja textilis]
MDPVLYVVAAVLLAALLVFVSRVRGQARAGDEEHRQNVAAAVAAAARPQPLAGERGEGMPRHRRNRLVALRRSQQAEEAAEEDNGAEPAEFQVSGKIGAKKQRKLEEKQARKAQREAEEAEREERKKVEQKRDEERRLEEERLRQEEERKEEELKKAKEEEERQEYEEYLKLKEGFVVEEEGMDEAMTEEQSRSFVTELLNYIKNAKVVLLEDLASHLGLRTQDAINRVQDLMADGTLTGVIDDRGKFIYITPQELTAVAEFIRRRGRVSITELAQESNSLINLQMEAGFLSQSTG